MNKITVIIAEKECILKFTMHSIVVMGKMKGDTEGEPLTLSGTYDNAVAMVWGGLNGWWRVSNQEPDVTIEDVTDFVEAAMLNNPEIIIKITECMTEANAYKSCIKAAVEEETKKKSIGMKSEPSPSDA